MAPRIEALEPKVEALDEEQFRKESLSLRYRAKSGEPLERLLVEAYALVREAARRALDMRHYDVQMLGGIAMHHRSIAEMQTGEGKTLTATLPLYLAAIVGKGAHLATANDYLAQRDADWMRPLFDRLGMTVGVIQAQQPSEQRRAAYAADVTYGTAKEFGFDFLRDRLLKRRTAEGQSDLFGAMLGQQGQSGEKPVQRELHFLLADEADSILIDEARTPLVISALPGEDEQIAAEAYLWAAKHAGDFTEVQHYQYDPKKRTVELAAAGRRLTRELPKPDSMHTMGMFTIYEYIERAVKVEREMVRDRHYVIRDGEIVIVDEFTGRLAEGRKWRAGLHQAVEAREGVEVTFETGQAARITVQDFVLRYQRCAGMTGTAATSARELHKIYGLQVISIPTNRPPIRKKLAERIYGHGEAKWAAIAAETAEVHATGRPVLIGTRSIDKSEVLSKLLVERGIEHEILNANHLPREAEIVARAGERGRVTVSTNMAGRGTDIKLGEGVAELGGMHVICTELHESQRIDRQLIGRCGRQGDPGAYRQYLALDDDILREGLGVPPAERLKLAGAGVQEPLTGYGELFRRAQRRIERRHFRDRKVLLYHEKERKKMQIQMGQDPYLDAPG
jgi:preprotein translocase subunit SecA